MASKELLKLDIETYCAAAESLPSLLLPKCRE